MSLTCTSPIIHHYFFLLHPRPRRPNRSPQDSAWQTKIESRLKHLTSTVDAILAALQSSGVAVHVPPPLPSEPQSPEQGVRGGVLAQAVAAVAASGNAGPYHPGIASGAFDVLGSVGVQGNE